MNFFEVEIWGQFLFWLSDFVVDDEDSFEEGDGEAEEEGDDEAEHSDIGAGGGGNCRELCGIIDEVAEWK